MVELGAGILFHCHLWKQRNRLILTGIVDFKTGQSYVSLCTDNSVMLFRQMNSRTMMTSFIHYQLEKHLSRN